jgi:hypothetical protein
MWLVVFARILYFNITAMRYDGSLVLFLSHGQVVATTRDLSEANQYAEVLSFLCRG